MWTPRRWTRCCASSPTSGVRSLVSQPPTLEELFLRHYSTPTAPRGAQAASQGVPMSAFTGTGTLLRLALRLDRVRLSVWVLVHRDPAGRDGGAVPEAVPDRAVAPDAVSGVVSNPSLVALNGPLFERVARRPDRVEDRRDRVHPGRR